eukprot:scaffold16219_cov65-Phaeocystis_antarctica.AAC.12
MPATICGSNRSVSLPPSPGSRSTQAHTAGSSVPPSVPTSACSAPTNKLATCGVVICTRQPPP